MIGSFSMTCLIVLIPTVMSVAEWRNCPKNKKYVPFIVLWGTVFTGLGWAAAGCTLLEFI